MIYSLSFFNSWIYNLLLIHPVQRFPRLSSSFPCTLPGLLLPSMLLSLSASLWGLFSLGISVWAPKGHFQTSSELQGVGFPKRARVPLPEATSRGGKGACEIPPVSSLLPASGRASVYSQPRNEMFSHLCKSCSLRVLGAL